MLAKIEIRGLRGFAARQTLALAIPDGANPGSGLTVVVGANNSGKSTIIEAFRAVQQSQPPGFTQGRRNRTAGDQVDIAVVSTMGQSRRLRSVRRGASETQFDQPEHPELARDLFVLPSRRSFNPYFGQGQAQRAQYGNHLGFPPIRTSAIDIFSQRLFAASADRENFNSVLGRVLDPVPDWVIDQLDTGQYYLKVSSGRGTHSSEGLGEGIVSLFFVIDALYDSSAGSTIVIDEPELSLHPQLQRKLAVLLDEYAVDRQIVVATHSPYFVNLRALSNGARVARVHQRNNQSRIDEISPQSRAAIQGLLQNQNNPHIFGLKAQEVFFLDDHVVLVEGQEDVVLFEEMLSQLGLTLRGEFFGWGAGGAGNISHIASILNDLGFQKVVAVLDGDKAHLAPGLQRSFPAYHFVILPAADIRTKERRIMKRKIGLFDTHGLVRKKLASPTRQFIQAINAYLEN